MPPPRLQAIFLKAYWTLAAVGMVWAVGVALLLVPGVQRWALYAHRFQTSLWSGDVGNAEEFGFAKGQVQPFWLETADKERLFCWHVIPLDVYLEHENELVLAADGEVAEELRGTIGEKLMRRDQGTRVVVNFHGNAGHIAQNHRPSLYRSISGIPKTHLLSCSYRGFGSSTLRNPPHLPTETGLITDAISLLSYLHTTLSHPTTRTVLIGHSLGTAVTAASALYLANPTSPHLPANLSHPLTTTAITPSSSIPPTYAAIILIAPFRTLPSLLQSYKIAGFLPILKPLRAYPRIENFLTARILDTWSTLPRLLALLEEYGGSSSRSADITASNDAETESETEVTAKAKAKANPPPKIHITLLHARNDPAIPFAEAEALFAPLQSALLGAGPGATAEEQRRSILGAERVARGAFAYRRVEDGEARRSVELEVVRFGGHNEVVGWSRMGLAVRRAFVRGAGEE